MNEQTKGDGSSIAVRTCGDASALHVSTAGGLNLVGIGNLRVMVKNDGERWSAQGLEIDYAVDGGSFEDVTQEFAYGLTLTIDENLRVFGHIKHVLKTAPPETWAEFFDGVLNDTLEVTHTQLSIHRLQTSVYTEKVAA